MIVRHLHYHCSCCEWSAVKRVDLQAAPAGRRISDVIVHPKNVLSEGKKIGQRPIKWTVSHWGHEVVVAAGAGSHD